MVALQRTLGELGRFLVAFAMTASSTFATELELLTNGGFETGDLTGWSVVTVPGNVVPATAAFGCTAVNPGTPLTGSFLYCTGVRDGVAPGTGEVTIEQVADVASIAAVGHGLATTSASGYLSGAEGCPGPSDDVVRLVIYFYNGGLVLGSATSVPIAPDWGHWNPCVVDPVPAPVGTNRIVLALQCLLGTDDESIDIGVDDLSLRVDIPTAAPEVDLELSSWGALKSDYRGRR